MITRSFFKNLHRLGGFKRIREDNCRLHNPRYILLKRLQVVQIRIFCGKVEPLFHLSLHPGFLQTAQKKLSKKKSGTQENPHYSGADCGF